MNTSKLHTTRFFLSRRDLMRTAAVAAAGLGAGLLGLAPGQGTAAENSPTNPAPIQQGKGHPFVCTDYTGGKVFIVTADGKAEWEYPAETCNDLWVLPNGNLLFNTGHGVREVTRDKKVVFDYQSKSEIYACQRLANGNTFVGECNAGRLLEVTPDGKIAKEIRLLPEGQDGGHAYIRNVRCLANGHYLVAHYGGQVVKEYDADGKVVREIPAPGGPHSVARLANGNTLIACGDATKRAQIFEVDPAGKIVWQIQDGDLPGISLFFMTGFQRLPNGNTVLTNWVGHGHFGQAPHIIEVTADKKVVWTFSDHATMKTISNIQLLDVPGDVVKGEIIH
ncbi:MAG TPA: twin-arginine translocation signal domain-containing protein [Candidatus Sumerlaeota bacterium]|nr:twin-arginine translocation signal domain-containing protein [Candidatus Sumerlaeota bacterium]